jgi:2'-5' RNA ligase
MSVIRAFIAIDLSADIRRELDRLSNQLRQQMKALPVRWVPAGNIHLTLKFLGNVSPATLETLQNALQAEAARYAPFELRVGELGAFPSNRRPRVVWVNAFAPAELNQLQRGVEEQANRLGYAPEERGFTPHLTLGRVSRNANNSEIQRIGQALDTIQVGELGVMQVQDVRLFRSDLQPTGAVYTCLFIAQLKSER